MDAPTLQGVLLQDILPQSFSQAQIFLYGYNSTYIVTHERQLTRYRIREHTIKLVQSVIENREEIEVSAMESIAENGVLLT